MSTEAHTPEPWEWRESEEVGILSRLFGADDVKVCDFGDEIDYFPGEEPSEADRKRMSDCVNACVGMNPAAVPALLAACKYLASTQGKIPKFVGSDFIEIARDLAADATDKARVVSS